MRVSIAITGLGVCSPLGEGTAANWRRLLKGAAETPGLSPSYPGERGAIRLAEKAVEEALRQAGLWDGQKLHGVDPERLGCTLSASKPFFDESLASILPPETVNQSIRRHFGLRGESRNVIAACATGAYAIALAASWIEQGVCDVVVAGSVEPTASPLIAAGFRRMGVLSGEGVTRPFDRDRSGFVMGAGAGVVVLESADRARRRGQSVCARLSGWGLGADGHSAVAFNSGGGRIADVIVAGLRKAGLRPADIQHVNAHGTATRLNDRIETQALVKAFGSRAGRLMISATKSGTGHLLGASGSVECVFAALALQRQFVPPTATLRRPDPQCRLDYTPRQGHAARIDHALSLSFGFGGPIGALVVSGPC